ncbi:universal stress protein [Streptomyces sp. NPDC053560]|uniref:universal stress protein n=1 Tax=Streptomyces sp. NPDC053560 TaxID=3365711 RepID=UPI0037CFB828
MSHPPQAPHGRVVIGFDGSAHAERALDCAADEARRRDAALEILAGWPWPKRPLPDYGVQDDEGKLLYSSARRMMDGAVERARSRAPNTLMIPSLTTESAADALLRCGRTASLTVVGTRGHGGFAGLLLGSVSLRVAAHCTSPLMVVRGGVDRIHGTAVLGLASDTDADPNVKALRFAFDEAARREAELRVLHAWQFPAPHADRTRPSQLSWDDVAGLRKAAEAVPQYAIARLAQEYPDVRASALTVCQSPAQALVESSRDADVVILAAHRRPRPFGLQLGPVTHAALHHAHCPVVLVPTG